MKTKLINVLSEFGYPVILQGSLDPDTKYPESFFTFWNNSSDDGSHYDNDAISFVWNFDVTFYSTDAEKVNTILLQARDLLKQNGFICSGRGYDVASDEVTHTGRGMNVLTIENNSQEEQNG